VAVIDAQIKCRKSMNEAGGPPEKKTSWWKGFRKSNKEAGE
jgi:hypothetical protein